MVPQKKKSCEKGYKRETRGGYWRDLREASLLSRMVGKASVGR